MRCRICQKTLAIGITVFWLYAVFTSVVFSQDLAVRDFLSKKWVWQGKQDSNVCGLFSAIRALELLGKPANVDAVWNAKYMSHREGSTPEELRQSVQDLGGHGVLTTGLSALELRSLQFPVISNVKGDLERSVYDHWVCVQPSYDFVTVYDGAANFDMSYPEFLAKWNGIGLIVSEHDYGMLCVFGVRALGVGTLILIASVVIRKLGKRSSTRDESPRRAILNFFAVWVVVEMFGSWIYGTTFLGQMHRNATNNALLSHVHSTHFEGGMKELIAAKDEPSHLLIDARHPHDYAAGTIGQAANIPVFADIQAITQFLLAIPKQTPIVVFCQSRQCSYNTVVGNRLVKIGFSNVTVVSEGYVEFMAQSQSGDTTDQHNLEKGWSR